MGFHHPCQAHRGTDRRSSYRDKSRDRDPGAGDYGLGSEHTTTALYLTEWPSIKLRDVLLEAVRKEVARAEFRARLARRDPVRLDRPGRALEETRAERDSEIDS